MAEVTDQITCSPVIGPFQIVQDTEEGLDGEMSFELKFLMLPYTITEMSWFFDYSVSTSEELVREVLRGVYLE